MAWITRRTVSLLTRAPQAARTLLAPSSLRNALRARIRAVSCRLRTCQRSGRGMGKRPGENMNLRGGFPLGTDRLQRTGKAAEIQKFFGKEKMILLNSWKNEHILGSTCEKTDRLSGPA